MSHQDRFTPAGAAGHQREAFLRRCRERGLRVTPQRLAVYRVLAEDPTHPTADSVHARASAVLPSLSVATVYRILESFQREGLIRKISTAEGAWRFDANLDPHQHLVCRSCQSVVDLCAPSLAEVTVPVSLPEEFTAEEVDVQLVGLCRSCRDGKD
jgi:Fur family peroxide stress response transcriptional regulator